MYYLLAALVCLALHELGHPSMILPLTK